MWKGGEGGREGGRRGREGESEGREGESEGREGREGREGGEGKVLHYIDTSLFSLFQLLRQFQTGSCTSLAGNACN